jgi:hypothetical protein
MWRAVLMRVVAKKIERWVFPLALGWLVVALASPVAAQQPAGALVISGPAPELFLLYTGDVIGYLDPCG